MVDKCEIQLGYAIGVARPVPVVVETFGTGKVSDQAMEDCIDKNLDLRPAAIISRLQLHSPIYSRTAAYGHFGKEELSWEKLNDCLIASLKELLH